MNEPQNIKSFYAVRSSTECQTGPDFTLQWTHKWSLTTAGTEASEHRVPSIRIVTTVSWLSRTCMLRPNTWLPTATPSWFPVFWMYIWGLSCNQPCSQLLPWLSKASLVSLPQCDRSTPRWYHSCILAPIILNQSAGQPPWMTQVAIWEPNTGVKLALGGTFLSSHLSQ